MGGIISTSGITKKGTPKKSICQDCNSEFITVVDQVTIKGPSMPKTRCDPCYNKLTNEMLKTFENDREY
jgi:hypothetical protein